MEKIGVYCASSDTMAPIYYECAKQLGRWLGENKKTLVYGGHNCGLMEAVAQATKAAGGKVFGVVPKKLVEMGTVSDAIDITFYCNDLSDRKEWLVQESDVLVAMPGSVGTLDEAFSTMAANSFGMHNKRVIFWNIDGYFDKLFEFFDDLSRRGAVYKDWSEVMGRANTLEELTAQLQ